MKHIIINIGRQLGSGGHDIGRMLALDFQAKYYDRELLNLAAKESGLSEKIFEQNDEKKGFFRGLLNLGSPHVSSGRVYNSGVSQESLFQFQSDAIRKAAEKGSCIFVGRCADYVLRDMKGVVNIFITADMDQRIQAVCKRHGCDRATARKIITSKEDQRSSYYNYYTGQKWGNAENYHLCINSSVLGIEGTAEFIKRFIKNEEDRNNK